MRATATVPAASRGYDGGKKVPDHKRHIVTDMLGLLLDVAVTAANIGDRDAATGLPQRLRRLHRADLGTDALTAAIRTRSSLAGSIMRTGHGAQYTSRIFAQACR